MVVDIRASDIYTEEEEEEEESRSSQPRGVLVVGVFIQRLNE